MKTNPFATRYIRPGAIRYEFFGRSSATSLIERFLQLPKRCGMIVGPHGSGKSTLIATLIAEFQSSWPDQVIHHARFSSDSSSRQALKAAIGQWTDGSTAVLDGYEQLGLWSRFVVQRVSRKMKMRILATAHRPCHGFVELWKTSVEEDSSKWVIEQLLSEPETRPIATRLLQSEEWNQSRQIHGQNLRESLFDMYDWWQKNEHHMQRDSETSGT